MQRKWGGRRRNRWLRPWPLVLLLLLWLPALAGAHARLTGVEPVDGAVLEKLPAQLELQFSAAVRPASLRLVAANAGPEPVALSGDADGRRLIVHLPADLPNGGYSLEYRVLAADDHVVHGALGYTVAVATAGDPPQAAAAVIPPVVKPLADSPAAVADRPVQAGIASQSADYRWLAWGLRAAFLLLLLLAAGLALFSTLMPVPAPLDARLRRALGWLALAGLAVTPMHLQASGLLAIDAAGLLDPAAWRLASGGSLAVSLSLAAPGFLLLAVVARRAGPVLLLAGVALLLLSRGLTGHPAARDPAWLLMPAMVLHAGCAAWWYGALWPLDRALATQPQAVAAALVNRFAALAMLAVALLAFAGLMMALVHLAAPSALASTDYGRLLLGKVTLFALLLGLGAWHRLALSPRLLRGDTRARALLRAGIGTEAVLMTLLLLVSVSLTGSAPELSDGGFWR